MNSWCTPDWIGSSNLSDRITDFTVDLGSSFNFGFDFPEKLEAISVPSYNGFWFDNNERFAPRAPYLRKQNPEKPILCFDLRSSVDSFHHGQLLAKCEVLNC